MHNRHTSLWIPGLTFLRPAQWSRVLPNPQNLVASGAQPRLPGSGAFFTPPCAPAAAPGAPAGQRAIFQLTGQPENP